MLISSFLQRVNGIDWSIKYIKIPKVLILSVDTINNRNDHINVDIDIRLKL